MKNLSLLFFLFLSVTIYAQQRNTTLNSTSASSINQSAAAKVFGISVVKSFFESNCPSVYEKLAPTVINVQSKFLSPSTVTPTPKDIIRKTDFCANTPLKDKTTSWSTYLANYEPTIMDHRQFATNYPRQQTILNLRSGDFFFDGAVLKPNGVILFNTPSSVQFVVRQNSRGVFEITMITLP
jgi:hypothetical protein